MEWYTLHIDGDQNTYKWNFELKKKYTIINGFCQPIPILQLLHHFNCHTIFEKNFRVNISKKTPVHNMKILEYYIFPPLVNTYTSDRWKTNLILLGHLLKENYFCRCFVWNDWIYFLQNFTLLLHCIQCFQISKNQLMVIMFRVLDFISRALVSMDYGSCSTRYDLYIRFGSFFVFQQYTLIASIFDVAISCNFPIKQVFFFFKVQDITTVKTFYETVVHLS